MSKNMRDLMKYIGVGVVLGVISGLAESAFHIPATISILLFIAACVVAAYMMERRK